jgi:hypothetical protein
MVKTLKILLVGISASLIVLFVTSNFSYPLIMGNFGENLYDYQKESSTRITVYIVEGAGNFLQAYSDILLLLNRVEMAGIDGIDYKEVEEMLDRAIMSLDQAKGAYERLTRETAYIPYNTTMIDKLLRFDYPGFEKERGLNAAVFKKVRSYLFIGDVRGIYRFLLENTVVISKQLHRIKEYVAAGKFPGISRLWRLNQDFAETILFGQHAAQVFQTLSTNER